MSATLPVVKWDGNKISRAGIYENVPIATYHSGHLCVGPSISSTGLRTIFEDSEEDYFDKSPYNPDRAEDEERDEFTFGRALHHAILGERDFVKRFVVRPDTYVDKKGEAKPWSGNALKCKEWLKEAAAADLTVLTPAMLEQIKGMAIKLGMLPLVRAGVLNGLVECSMVWQDAETGVWLLARPDVIPTDSGNYVDIKSTTRTNWTPLVRTLGEYNYHQQAALVAEGHRILTGREIEDFSFYFVRKTRPYSARMVTLKPDDLALGERQNHFALRRFVKAFNSGKWPGPGGLQEEVQYIELSDRRRQEIENRLKNEGELTYE
jgi:hypothetical protein